jgi:FtsZ-interacting cell division protein ZipA
MIFFVLFFPFMDLYAAEIPGIAEPSGDMQYLLYIFFGFLAWVSYLIHNVWVSKNNKSDVKDPFEAFNKIMNERDDHVISKLEVFELKFENMVSSINGRLTGKYDLLDQKVDSVQRELTEFKMEYRERKPK